MDALQRTEAKAISNGKVAKPAVSSLAKACSRCLAVETRDTYKLVFGVMWAGMAGVSSAEPASLVEGIAEARSLDGAAGLGREGALRLAAAQFVTKRGRVTFSGGLRLLAGTVAVVEMRESLGGFLESLSGHLEEEDREEAEYVNNVFFECEQSGFGLELDAAKYALGACGSDEDYVSNLQAVLAKVTKADV